MAIDLARETAEIAMDAFGEPITFDGVERRAIVSTEVVELAGYERAVEHRTIISVLIDEYPLITPGAPVIARGKSYVVDQQMDASDDPSVMAKLVLR